MGFTIEEGQESYPLFSPASHCPLTVRTLETLGHNRDPRMAAARILQKYLPTSEWFRFFFILESSIICPEYLSLQNTKILLAELLPSPTVCCWLFRIILYCTFPSITEEITKTDDANLVDHLAGAHGDSADTLYVQLPWSQRIVQPSSGRFCRSKYSRNVMRPFPEVT